MNRAVRRAVAPFVVALLLTACTRDPEPTPAPVPPAPTDEAPAEDDEDDEDTSVAIEAGDPAGEPADEAESQPDPVDDPAEETWSSDEFPRWGDDPVRLVDARLLPLDGHDRLVLEFDGALPSWEVREGERPVREQPTGTEVELPGEGLLEVRLVPATTLDRDAADPTAAYEGPAHLEGHGGGVLEALLTGDHGDLLVWSVALDDARPVAVAELEDPPRLVVDVITAG